MNPYKILNIKEEATKQQIKNAYRNLSKIHHPDKGGSAEKFDQIRKAYKVLSNDKLREEYDYSGFINESYLDETNTRVFVVLSLALEKVLDNLLKLKRAADSVDLVALIKEVIKYDMEQIEKDKSKFNVDKAIKTLLLGRFKCSNKDDNIMETILLNGLKKLDSNIEHCNALIRENEVALDCINNFVFELKNKNYSQANEELYLESIVGLK